MGYRWILSGSCRPCWASWILPFVKYSAVLAEHNNNIDETKNWGRHPNFASKASKGFEYFGENRKMQVHFTSYHYGDVIMTTIASEITSPTIIYSTVYSGPNQRKHQSSASLACVRGIHRWPVNSPHKGQITRKMFPFGDVIMFWRFLVLCATPGATLQFSSENPLSPDRHRWDQTDTTAIVSCSTGTHCGITKASRIGLQQLSRFVISARTEQ